MTPTASPIGSQQAPCRRRRGRTPIMVASNNQLIKLAATRPAANVVLVARPGGGSGQADFYIGVG